MNTSQKIKKLELKGWVLSFNKDRFKHEARRGMYIYEASSITSLYEAIDNDFQL